MKNILFPLLTGVHKQKYFVSLFFFSIYLLPIKRIKWRQKNKKINTFPSSPVIPKSSFPVKFHTQIVYKAYNVLCALFFSAPLYARYSIKYYITVIVVCFKWHHLRCVRLLVVFFFRSKRITWNYILLCNLSNLGHRLQCFSRCFNPRLTTLC